MATTNWQPQTNDDVEWVSDPKNKQKAEDVCKNKDIECNRRYIEAMSDCA